MKSNIEWKNWGKSDPLYGVAAVDGKRKDEAEPWTVEEFLNNGAAEWRLFVRHWEQYGLRRNSCLEIGCGAGRITNQLAHEFLDVRAIDVSEDMIAYAREHIDTPNVTYYVSNGTNVPLPEASVTAVFSSLVFRHFDSTDFAVTYFREIHRVLAPDGTLMIELPVYAWPNLHREFAFAYGIRKALGDLRATFRRYLLAHGRGQPFFRAQCYEIDWLYSTLSSLGFSDVEIRVLPIASSKEEDRRSFVFARKVADAAKSTP